MPIRDLPDPDAPEVDTRMLEFVARRREEHAQARRQRIQLIAIIALGLIGVVLTVSNAVLVSRLVARPATPPLVLPPRVRSAPPSTSAAETGDAGSPAAAVPSESRAAASAPSNISTGPRANAAPAARPPARPRPSSPVMAETPAVPPPAESVPAASAEPPALPERTARTTSRAPMPESVRPSAPRESLSPAVEVDPAMRTARWMIRTYGPLDAEGKALAAAEFYTGDEGAFWRRVVAHVRAER
jgi:hypothetical protein